MYKYAFVITQEASGGGGGGRIAITAEDSYGFLGSYGVRGGYSAWEVGGSGTAFILQPDGDGGVTRKLYADNENLEPLVKFANNVNNDAARTYVVASDELGKIAVWVLAS